MLPTGLPQTPVAHDLPSSLILRSCICLLRSLVVGMSVHSGDLSKRSLDCVANLLRYIVLCGSNKGKEALCGGLGRRRCVVVWSGEKTLCDGLVWGGGVFGGLVWGGGVVCVCVCVGGGVV